MRQNPSNGRMDTFVRPNCPFDCLSVVSARGVHPLRGMKHDASWKFKGEGKIPESTNKYTKFGQLIITNILKLLPPDVTF